MAHPARTDADRVVGPGHTTTPATRWMVAAATLGVFLVHLIPGLDTGGPVVFEDEIGYLMNGRAIAGLADGARLHEMGFYHAGWSLLLAPLNWVFSDAAASYRAALTLTALLGALAVLPLTWLGRRALGLAPTTAVLAASVAALYPGRVLMSGYVYAESLLALSYLVALVAAWHFWHRRSTASAVLFGLSAAWLYAVHGRAIGIVVVTVLLLAVAALRGRDLRPLAGVAASIMVVVGTEVVHRWLKGAIYLPRTSRLSGSVGNLPDTRPRSLLAATLGQSWYLAVASLGLVAAGAVELVRRLRHVWRTPEGSLWWWWLGSFVAVAAVTLPAMARSVARGLRLDYVIYGRYMDAFVPALVLLGAATLAGPVRRTRPLVPVLAAPLLALATRVVSLSQYLEGLPIAALSVAGIAVWIDPGGQAVPLVVGSLGATAGAAAIFWLPWRSVTPRLVLAAALFVVLSIAGEIRTMGALDAPWQSLLQLQHVVSDLDPTAISYDEHDDTIYGRNGYQFWLPDTRFEFFDSGTGERPDTALVIARRDWPLADELDAALVTSEERLDEALWVMPGPLQDRLRAQGRLSADP